MERTKSLPKAEKETPNPDLKKLNTVGPNITFSPFIAKHRAAAIYLTNYFMSRFLKIIDLKSI